jgi:hypothetical protein
MRSWLFGKTNWSQPWMRWLGMPLFRVGLLLLVVSIVVSGHSTTVTWIGVALMGISLVVEIVNFLLARARVTAP